MASSDKMIQRKKKIEGYINIDKSIELVDSKEVVRSSSDGVSDWVSDATIPVNCFHLQHLRMIIVIMMLVFLTTIITATIMISKNDL